MDIESSRAGYIDIVKVSTIESWKWNEMWLTTKCVEEIKKKHYHL